MKKYTGIYCSWYAMKQRCTNPNNKSYENYGGRGITYDPKWEKFAGFEEDMGCSHKRGLTLERLNVDEGYNKKNCKWIPKKLQTHNTRQTVWLEFQGEKKTLMQWSKDLGLDYGTLRSRMYRGMETKQILKPKLYRPRKL